MSIRITPKLRAELDKMKKMSMEELIAYSKEINKRTKEAEKIGNAIWEEKAQKAYGKSQKELTREEILRLTGGQVYG